MNKKKAARPPMSCVMMSGGPDPIQNARAATIPQVAASKMPTGDWADRESQENSAAPQTALTSVKGPMNSAANSRCMKRSID